MKHLLLTTLLFSTHLHAAIAVCSNSGSDADGDGWGWENNQTCQVTDDTTGTLTSTCDDPDGDGWGWHNGASCRVTDTSTGNNNDVQDSACIDDDGDGWGWANGASCRVTGTSAGNDNDGQNSACIDYDGDGWGWANGQSCMVETNDDPSPDDDNPVPDNEEPDNEPPAGGNQYATDFPRARCSNILGNGQNINNALSSANTTICLGAGRYTISQSIKFKNNQTLAGLDASNPPTIVAAANRTLTTTGANTVNIENIILDGNSTGAREFAILVGKGSSNITLKNIRVQNTIGIGIGITGSSNVRLLGSTIRNIGLDQKLRQAVWVTTGSRTVLIDGLTVVGRQNDKAGGDHAITCIDGVHGFTVNNTSSTYAGSGAIAINNCSAITVTNNTLIDGREHGVDIVNGSSGAVVRNNIIRGFDRSAMVFDDHSWKCASCGSNPTGIIVTGNTMSGNNKVKLARCRGIAVDKAMTINPSAAQKANTDWVEISGDNKVDSDSALYCDHIH